MVTINRKNPEHFQSLYRRFKNASMSLDIYGDVKKTRYFSKTSSTELKKRKQRAIKKNKLKRKYFWHNATPQK